MSQQAVNRDEQRRLPAELQFVLIVLAILMVIAFAGLPGSQHRIAGDGSSRLRHGWTAQQAAQAAAPAAAPGATGLDHSEPQR